MNSPYLTFVIKKPGDFSAYIRKPDVVYHLVYEGEGVSLDTILQLMTVNLVGVDGFTALNSHYMVNLLPPLDGSINDPAIGISRIRTW